MTTLTPNERQLLREARDNGRITGYLYPPTTRRSNGPTKLLDRGLLAYDGLEKAFVLTDAGRAALNK